MMWQLSITDQQAPVGGRGSVISQSRNDIRELEIGVSPDRLTGTAGSESRV